jgi:hypothetical protein
MTQISEFRQLHMDKVCIVAGCGTSAKALYDCGFDGIIIGMNAVELEIGVSPNYLVVVDRVDMPRHVSYQHRERSKLILETKCDYVFARRVIHMTDFEDYPITFSSPVIKITTGRFEAGWEKDLDEAVFPLCTTSATVATALAIYMGFKSIGMVGIDLVRHKTRHNLSMIDQMFRKLYECAQSRGQELVNLSKQSALLTVPKWDLDEFCDTYRTEAV